MWVYVNMHACVCVCVCSVMDYDNMYSRMTKALFFERGHILDFAFYLPVLYSTTLICGFMSGIIFNLSLVVGVTDDMKICKLDANVPTFQNCRVYWC